MVAVASDVTLGEFSQIKAPEIAGGFVARFAAQTFRRYSPLGVLGLPLIMFIE